MFTGIIEELGVVKNIIHKTNLSVIEITCRRIIKGTKLGDSVALNGVCLTGTKIKKNLISFDVMKETLRVTTIGSLKKGDRVNLERALRVGDRLGGHFVSGHVDFVSNIQKIIRNKNYLELQFSLDKRFKRFVVAKGSVCIDGVSLTVGAVTQKYFSVYLIPKTISDTNFGQKKIDDCVNIEIDLIARYLSNL